MQNERRSATGALVGALLSVWTIGCGAGAVPANGAETVAERGAKPGSAREPGVEAQMAPASTPQRLASLTENAQRRSSAELSKTLRAAVARVQLPSTSYCEALREGPVILVTDGMVFLDGEHVGFTKAIVDENRPRRIDALFEMLRQRRRHDGSFDQRALLVVNREEPAMVVKSVFQTAGYSGYANSAFVVRCDGQPGNLGLLPTRAHIPTPEADHRPDRKRIGSPVARGKLPPEVIQSEVRRNYGSLRRCYEEVLKEDATASGRITVYFVISRDGKVSHAEAAESNFKKPFNQCIGDNFGKLEFPQPEGGIVTVRYPIMFTPN